MIPWMRLHLQELGIPVPQASSCGHEIYPLSKNVVCLDCKAEKFEKEQALIQSMEKCWEENR